jgi:hypothetical protein
MLFFIISKIFLGKGIDGEVLFSLNNADVEEIISNFGLRKKFINRLPANHPLAPTVVPKNPETPEQSIHSKVFFYL